MSTAVRAKATTPSTAHRPRRSHGSHQATIPAISAHPPDTSTAAVEPLPGTTRSETISSMLATSRAIAAMRPQRTRLRVPSSSD